MPNAGNAFRCPRTVPPMTTIEILALFLALSVALNLALSASILARGAGKSMPAATLVGASTATTALTIFFAAVSAYR
jgi:hypothetical protein